MWPLVTKVWREYGVWALLWAVGFGVALGIAVGSGRSYDAQAHLLRDAAQIVTLFGSALGAGLLGLLQIVYERRRDQWAFLLHRPASASEVYWGLTLGGLSLYAATMGLPLVAVGWWLAQPGSVAAPFEWRMLLPAVADLLTGCAFYFGLQLVALRRADWDLSRGLGLGLAAVVCVFQVAGAQQFWQAVVIIVVGCGVLALAARGNFISGGAYRSLPAAAKPAQFVTVYAGALLVVVFGGSLLWSLLPRSATISYQYAVTQDGAPIVVRSSYDGSLFRYDAVLDLDGHPIAELNTEAALNDLYTRVHLHHTSFVRPAGLRWKPGYRRSEHYFYFVGISQQAATYYLPETRRLVAYDYRTAARRDLGTIPGEPVSIAAYAGLLATDERVALLDLNTREQTILVNRPKQPIRGAGLLHGQGACGPVNADAPRHVAVALGDRVHVYDQRGRELLDAPVRIPAEFDSVSGTALCDGGFALEFGRHDQWEEPRRLEVYSAAGALQARYDLPWRAPELPHDSFQQAAPVVIMPPALPVVIVSLALLTDLMGYGNGRFGMDALTRGWSQEAATTTLLAIVAGILVIVLSLVITWRLTAREALPQRSRIWWLLAVLAGGIVAVVALLATRDWAARLPCPTCGRRRLVTRDACEHCGAPWAPPARDGTEIFATEPGTATPTTPQTV